MANGISVSLFPNSLEYSKSLAYLEWEGLGVQTPIESLEFFQLSA